MGPDIITVSRDVYAELLRAAPLSTRINHAIADWIEKRWMAWSKGIYS